MSQKARRVWTDALVRLSVLVLAVALAGALVWIGRAVHHTLLVGVLSLVLSVLLNPAVARLEEQRASRSLAVALVVAVAILLAVGLGLLLMRPLVAQANALVQALPVYFDRLAQSAPAWEKWLADLGVTIDYGALWSQLGARLEAGGAALLNGVLGVVSGVGAALADVILVAVLTIYLMLDGPRLGRALRAWVPERHRPDYDRAAAIVARLFGAYVRGQLLLALVLGLLAGFGTFALGVPYAAVIGVVAGLFELVPMAGPVLGAIPAVSLALLVSWRTALYVALYFVAIQQLEGHVLAPRITGRAVGLPPSFAVLALLAGFELAGVWGALFAVPVAGILSAVVGALWGPGARAAAAPGPEPGAQAQGGAEGGRAAGDAVREDGRVDPEG